MLSFSRLKIPISLVKKDFMPNHCLRTIVTGNPNLCKIDEDRETTTPLKAKETVDAVKYKKKFPIEDCLEYMESDAYKETYGDKPVWNLYIRNFKGGLPPPTRPTCMTSKGKIMSGSPCPICRDEYLLPHYLNVKLLEQFISPYGENIIDSQKTGVCQVQHFNLKVAIKKARNYGLIKFTVPHRAYDYSLYNKK